MGISQVEQLSSKAIKISMTPPPDFSVSEWADGNRRLSPEASAESGQWRTDRAEYQRGMMDAISNESIETVVIMTSSQVGKSEIELNMIGYYIDLDPCPMLMVYPTETLAKAFSEDRLSPMLRDTICLQGKVKDPRKRDSKNTKLHKMFPGGHISMVGANSPASLSARPIRLVLFDEVDRFPLSSGGSEGEGDVIALATARAKTFFNRKVIMVSTPAIKGISRIEAAYQESDQRRFYVPCHGCGEKQYLKWSQVQWDKDNKGEHLTDTAAYCCEKCGLMWSEKERQQAVKSGEWMADNEESDVAGFHLNELYSPWSRLSEIAKAFVDAKKSKSRERLQAFVNTVLGETWEEEGEEVDDNQLYNRREDYEGIPAEVAVLVSGVDVQGDSLEAHVVGFGLHEETWSVDYKVIHGDPAKPDTWDMLDQYLQKRYEHPAGHVLSVVCTCIDSGGHHTKQVYDYCKKKESSRIYAIKGSSQAGKPLVNRPTRSNIRKVKLFGIGTDTAKDLIFSRLGLDEFGPGYMHFKGYDREWFEQLASEKKVTKYIKGIPYRTWKQKRARNEVLDTYVYAFAAYAILNPNINIILDKNKGTDNNIPIIKEKTVDPTIKARRQQQQPRRQQNWINRGTKWTI